jgi:uncharacterized membrane protein YdjX (TVP38/TMEM64 family)
MMVGMKRELRSLLTFGREHLSSIVTILITVGVLAFISHLFSPEEITGAIDRAGVYGPLILIFMKIAAIVVAPISGAPLYPLAGALFGFEQGILYIVIGDFIGYTIAFSLSRFFGRSFIEKLIAQNERGLIARIVDHLGTTKGLIQVCFTFYAMPELIAYAAGLSRISFARFISVLFPLDVLGATVMVYFGSLFSVTEKSLMFVVVLPLISLSVVIIGGWLFVSNVRAKGHS